MPLVLLVPLGASPLLPTPRGRDGIDTVGGAPLVPTVALYTAGSGPAASSDELETMLETDCPDVPLSNVLVYSCSCSSELDRR